MADCTSRQLQGWLRLLRLPNLLTVPGDPLAGYLLATQEEVPETWILMGGVGAALLFYAGGLLCNDWCDRAEDARERPDRPIPSGSVAPQEVLVAWIILLAAGCLVCALMGPSVGKIGIALVLAILGYNFGLKRIPYVGPFIMGLCRGLSFLLGAAAGAPRDWYTPPVMLGFDILVLYVTSITYIAQRETQSRPLGSFRWTPSFVIAAAFALLAKLVPVPNLSNVAIFVGSILFSGVITLVVADALERAVSDEMPRARIILDPEIHGFLIPKLVGLLLSTLVMIQAALVSVSGASETRTAWAAVLISLWPIHRILAQHFYES